MPPFHNYATFYGKIQVKNIFSRMQISGMEKSILKSVSLISNCIFFMKKIFFLQNFCDFWVFLKFRSKVAKSETGTWFFRIFQTFWHLHWPWVCVRIEMGNLEAKTPCVYFCCNVNIFSWITSPSILQFFPLLSSLFSQFQALLKFFWQGHFCGSGIAMLFSVPHDSRDLLDPIKWYCWQILTEPHFFSSKF